jgi:hypothetical protein
MVNNMVHVLGWETGAVFRLAKVENGLATLITPKTKRKYVVQIDRLAYTRNNEPGDTSSGY